MSEYYNVKGVTRDSNGAPASREIVFMERDTNKVVTRIRTGADGTYQLYLPDSKVYSYIVKADPVHDIGCRDVFVDKLVPNPYTSPIGVVNDIGVPGQMGFGVGICPTDILPTDMVPMEGYDNPNHPNYGNYKCLYDNSIMVWIPAYYYKWGDGTNSLAINDFIIKPFSAYTDRGAAAADGFVLPRAFVDGGEIKKGFFIDKYVNTMNADKRCISSHPLSAPCTFASSPNNGAVSIYSVFTATEIENRVYEYITLSKTRGAGFHAPSVFMLSVIQMLCIMQKIKGTTSTCAFLKSKSKWPATYNLAYPGYSDSGDAISNRGQTQGTYCDAYLEKGFSAHNGQACGIYSFFSNMYIPVCGVSYNSSNGIVVFPESIKISDLTKANVINGSYYDGGHKNTPPYPTSVSWFSTVRYVKTTEPYFSSNTDHTSLEYRMSNVLIPKDANTQTAYVNSTLLYVGTGITPAAVFMAGRHNINDFGNLGFLLKGHYMSYNSSADYNSLISSRYVG